jgi:hypothetical protein
LSPSKRRKEGCRRGGRVAQIRSSIATEPAPPQSATSPAGTHARAGDPPPRREGDGVVRMISSVGPMAH